jgi:AraC-like DNA-binding protein
VSKTDVQSERLAAVVQLFVDLLQIVGCSAAREMPRHVSRFIDRVVERQDGSDTLVMTLVVSIAEQLEIRIGYQADNSPRSVLCSPWKARLLSRELLRQFDGSHQVHSVISNRTERLKEFIETHYHETLTLANMADSVGSGRSHAATTFRQETGMTLHAYLAKVRIRRAIEMLRQGEKVEAAMLLVGYRSKKNFYHQFKAQLGTTPGTYRRAV